MLLFVGYKEYLTSSKKVSPSSHDTVAGYIDKNSYTNNNDDDNNDKNNNNGYFGNVLMLLV